MSRRIDIELTSVRDDGTWTWRAAGAREPKGVLDGGLLFDGAAVGDVLKADADFDVDGITVTSVLPPKKPDARRPAQRIEILGPERRTDEPLVTTSLVPKGRRERPGRRDRRGGEGRDRHDSGDRRERREGRDTRESREARGPREGRGRSDGRPGGDRRPTRPRETRAEEARPKPKRLRPGRTHRKAVLAELAPEQRLVAEQILAGGIPAVRQAVDKHNEEARAAGQPEIKTDQMIEMAERLLPSLRVADWRDRADAALADIDELDLRDLRAVVTASDSVARDDETRALATNLREALTRREQEEQAQWLNDLTAALDDGRAVRALRISSRPPKAGTILAPETMSRLADAASASLTADTTAERWNAVLDALASAPVRKVAKPQSVPEEVSDELRSIISRYASRVPAVAGAFGIEAPPEPAGGSGPRGGRRSPGPNRGRPASSSPPPKPPARPAVPPPPPPAATKSAPAPDAVAQSEPEPQPEPEGMPQPEAEVKPAEDVAAEPTDQPKPEVDGEGSGSDDTASANL